MRWLAAGVSGGANVTASSGTRTAAMGTKPRVRGADAPSWSRSIVELRRDHRQRRVLEQRRGQCDAARGRRGRGRHISTQIREQGSASGAVPTLAGSQWRAAQPQYLYRKQRSAAQPKPLSLNP